MYEEYKNAMNDFGILNGFGIKDIFQKVKLDQFDIFDYMSQFVPTDTIQRQTNYIPHMKRKQFSSLVFEVCTKMSDLKILGNSHVHHQFFTMQKQSHTLYNI